MEKQSLLKINPKRINRKMHRSIMCKNEKFRIEKDNQCKDTRRSIKGVYLAVLEQKSRRAIFSS